MNMIELHDIMSNLSRVSFGIDSLRDVLMALEEAYDLNHDHSSQKLVHIIGRVLECLSEDLDDRIDEIDNYIICSNKAL